MLHKIVASTVLSCTTIAAFSQVNDSIPTKQLSEVSIQHIVVMKLYDPFSFKQIQKDQINKINYGQDVPYLLRNTPSLVATSDAGTGIGYTGLWIRGTDPSRINVTINDIPLNDPESQQVFWVNLPDFATSVNTLSVVRGVGNSTNGVASFGGTIGMQTNGISALPFFKLNSGGGAFGTLRNNVQFGTGTIKERFTFEGRLSHIQSDGYIDRASAKLSSYFLSGIYKSEKWTVKATTFGGHERTYQSWYGTPVSRLINNTDSMLTFAANNGLSEAETQNLLQSGRTYNYYTYENQVDDYSQQHYQLHVSREIKTNQTIQGALHYTRGYGYFEEYKNDQDYASYLLLAPNDSVTSTDLVRQRWLDNHFYGGNIAWRLYQSRISATVGGAFSQYLGNHFGKVIWTENGSLSAQDYRYYEGESTKNDGNAFAKFSFTQNNRWSAFADMQVRYVDYTTKGLDNDLRAYDVDTTMVFFNPKLGFTYYFNSNANVFISAAIGNKEPNRNDFVDAPYGTTPKPESMTDIEMGYRMNKDKYGWEANLYYMNYKDQLVLTGELNDVGAPLRINVDKSFRRGIELSGYWNVLTNLRFDANLTLSQNKIQAFDETLYDYSVDFDIVRIKHENKAIAFSPSIISMAQLQYVVWKKGDPNKPQYRELGLGLIGRYVGKQYLDNTQSEYLSIDAYQLMDASIQWRSTTAKNNVIELRCMVNNALDHMYSSNGYTYSYIYGSRITEKFYYPQAGRFLLISLGLEI
jgi:iron complex outermembrane receptor protein